MRQVKAFGVVSSVLLISLVLAGCAPRPNALDTRLAQLHYASAGRVTELKKTDTLDSHRRDVIYDTDRAYKVLLARLARLGYQCQETLQPTSAYAQCGGGGTPVYATVVRSSTADTTQLTLNT